MSAVILTPAGRFFPDFHIHKNIEHWAFLLCKLIIQFLSRDKGVNERPSELITTTNTSASGIHQSPITGFEQESCEMGDEFFSLDMFKDL